MEILTGDTTLILKEVQGSHLIGTSLCVGTRWPAHATSTGKVLLAAASQENAAFVRDFVRSAGGRLRRFTARTTRSATRLANQLAEVSRRGYSTAVDELEDGYTAIGAPLRQHDGRIVAAISLGGPTSRFPAARIRALAAPVCQAAERASQRLGWWPPEPTPRRPAGS